MAETKARSGGSRSRMRGTSVAERRKRSSRRGRAAQDELPDYSIGDPHELPDGPDVLLDILNVKVDEIDVEVDDLRAQVAVIAEVRDLVEVGVGADVSVREVELKVEGVEAQALFEARLDNVALILERTSTSLDRNPKLLGEIGAGPQQQRGDS